MELKSFMESLKEAKLPPHLSPVLKALWFDGIDDWNNAHQIVDGRHDSDSHLIHAYLHRKEGDQWNASYWYNRAGSVMPEYSLEEEWENLVKKYLAKA